MLCQNCHQHEATVLFTQIADHEKKVYHLCKTCADERSGAAGITVSVKATPQQKKTPKAEDDLVCAVCGETFSGFQEAGLFGCPSCYEAFAPKLDALLKRIHGVSRHRPDLADGEKATEESLISLEEQLRQAVVREEFEEAGRLRDRIAALKDQDQDLP